MTPPNLKITLMLAVLGIFLTWFISSVPAGARDRVAEARARKGDLVRQMVKDAGLAYPPYQILVRHFKLEHELEVWGRDQAAPGFRKIASYPVCASSGNLGQIGRAHV